MSRASGLSAEQAYEMGWLDAITSLTSQLEAGNVLATTTTGIKLGEILDRLETIEPKPHLDDPTTTPFNQESQ